jgi:hypothetical protein
MPEITVVPTRAGYIFLGYYDALTGGTKYYNADLTSANAWANASNKTLYARWQGVPYSVSFDANSGTGTMAAQEFEYGISEYLNTNAFTRTGYNFAGWNTEADGSGIAYANGASVLGKDPETGAPIFTADKNEAIDAVNFFIKLAKDDKVVLTDGGFWQEEAPYFRDGKSVFMITYANRVIEGINSNATTILDNSDTLKYGIVLPPKGPNATDYVSEKNWYTPWAAFKGHENMAGVVQCLSMYVAPEYAPDSAEAMMVLDSEASMYFDDERSIQTLKDIIKKNLTTDYMVWWDLGGDSAMNGVGELTTNKMAAWIAGETTPAQTYAENKDALNAYFANYVGANA